VAAFPLLPRSALTAGFEARAAALSALPRLPALAPSNGGAIEVCAASAAALSLPGAPPRALAALDTLAAARRCADVPSAASAAAAAAAEPPAVAAAATAAARDVALLALAGWRLRSDALRCDACGAVHGLWNLAPGRPPPKAPAYAAAASAARLAALSSPAPPPRANLTALFFSSSPPNKAVASRSGGAASKAVPFALKTIAGGVAPAATSSPVFGKRPAAAAFGAGASAFGSPPPAKTAKTADDAIQASPVVASPAPTAGGVASALAPLAPPASALPAFNALAGHRPHCPWVAAWPAAMEARSGGPEPPAAPSGAAPGWLQTLDALAPPQQAVPLAGGAGLPAAEMTPAAARGLVADLLAGRAIRPDATSPP
jgi:hypothetical protein